MAVGDATDIAKRLKAALVARWFATTAPGVDSSTPVLDGLLAGPAAMWEWLYALLQYVAKQRRIGTADGVNLDQIAQDFFGITLGRFAHESDAAYSARIKANLLAEKGTRAAIIAAVTSLTGFVPTVFEPADTTDTGGYSHVGLSTGMGLGYGVAGGYGSLALPFQAFVHAFRPVSVGIANTQGYYGLGSGVPLIGGYGSGSVEYSSLAQLVGQITDEDIYQTIAATAPEATIIWTAITSKTGVDLSPRRLAGLVIAQDQEVLSAAALASLGSGASARLVIPQASQLMSGAGRVSDSGAHLAITQGAQALSAAAFVPAIFNPADATGMTITNADLTATTNVATQSGVRSTSPQNAGLLYLEVTCTTAAASERIGLANGTWSRTAALGSDNNSIAIDPSGAVRLNNVVLGTGPTWTAGNNLQVATNFTTKKIFFGVNGSWGAVPSGVTGSQNTGTANPVITGPASGSVVAAPPSGGTPYITPGVGSFTDAAGNVYSIDSSDNAIENGSPIPGGSGTGAMEYANGLVYAQDASTLQWYTWDQTAFTASSAPPAPVQASSPTLSVTGVTLSDTIWPRTGNVTLAVSCTSGTVKMTVSGNAVAGSGTASINYSDTQANVQAAAASLVYTAPSSGASDTVVIKVTDQLGSSNTLSVPITLLANSDPATGVGGFSFASMAAGPYMLAYGAAASGEAKTANFGGSSFAQAIPSGYSAWSPATAPVASQFALSTSNETPTSVSLTWTAVGTSSNTGVPGVPQALSVGSPTGTTLTAKWQPPASGGTPTSYQLQSLPSGSPDGTVVTPGSGTITDTVGNIWAINTSGQITENGVADTVTANVVELAWVSQVIWQKNSAGNWYIKVNGVWTQQTGGPTIPTPKAQAWSNAPLMTASPDGTVITPSKGTIVDQSGNVWAINAGGQITENGTADTVTANVTQAAWINQTVWQENSAGNWYIKVNGQWTQQSSGPTFPAVPTLTQTVTGLTAGSSYQFRVLAKNASGDGPATDVVTAATNAVTAAGVFRANNTGGITGPNGNTFIAQGVNCLTTIASTMVTNAACQPLTSLAPNCNIVCLANQDANIGGMTGYDVTATINQLDQVITWLTARNIVVVIADYTNTNESNGGATGQELTNAANWFAGLASHYANNPYVWWLSGPNEGGNQGGNTVSQEHSAIYNAIRGAGNNAPIGFNQIGGYTFSGFSDADGHYSSMTNVFWSIHPYGWEPNSLYSLNEGSVSDDQQFLRNQIAAGDFVRSKDGVIPVICAEFGNANGSTPDAINGETLFQVVQTYGPSVCSGWIMWIYYWPGSGQTVQDNLVYDSTTTLTPGYGDVSVGNMIASRAPGLA